MVTTRSTKGSNGSSLVASPPAVKRARGTKTNTAALREAVRLEIEATAALGGMQTVPKHAGKIYKSSGGYWADIEPSVTFSAPNC